VGLGTVAVVAGSAAGYVLWPRVAEPGRQVLSALDERVARALIEVYLPDDNPFGLPSSAVDIVAGIDGYLAAMPLTQSRLLRGLLASLEQWPRVSWTSASTLSALPLAERTAVLRAFETSRVKDRQQVAGLLRLLVAIPFFDDPRVRAAPDYQFGCPVIP